MPSFSLCLQTDENCGIISDMHGEYFVHISNAKIDHC